MKSKRQIEKIYYIGFGRREVTIGFEVGHGEASKVGHKESMLGFVPFETMTERLLVHKLYCRERLELVNFKE